MAKLNLHLGADTRSAMAGISKVSASFKVLRVSAASANQAVGKLVTTIKTASGKFTNLFKDANRASEGVGKLGKSFGALGLAAKAYVALRIANVIARQVQSAMDMVEVANLYTVALGDSTAAANNYVNVMEQIVGLDATNVKSAIGTYALLARSMGMAAEQGEHVAIMTSQLAMDLSSLTNVPINQVLQDLRSGLLGQSETVYKYGLDVTEAALKSEALALGIEKSVRNMSQGEKLGLRFNVMIRQSGLAQGDFAKTIEQPANQARILRERLIQLSRAIGTIFLPALAAILPYANAVVKALTELANVIAGLAGYEEFEAEGAVGNIGTSADGATDSVNGLGKALKKLVAPFDELHVIDDGGGGGGGLGAITGITDDYELLSYDAMFAHIKQQSDAIYDSLVEHKTEIFAIATGLATILTTMGLIKATSVFTGLSTLSKALGAIGIAFGGVLLAFDGISKIVSEDAPDWTSFAEAFGGVALLAIAVGILFTPVAGLIALLVGAVALAIIYAVKYKKEIVAWFTEIKAMIKRKFDDILTNVEEFFEDGLSTITEEAPKLVEAFMKSIDELPERVGSTLGLVLGKFVTWQANILIWIATALPEIIENFLSFYYSIPNKILGALLEVLVAFDVWLFKMGVWLLLNLPGLVGKIDGYFKDLPHALYSIGVDMIKDLWKGMKSSTGWLGRKIKEFVKGFKEGFKNGTGNINLSTDSSYSTTGTYNVGGFASGGYPSKGQMFVAREAGAELVGNLGGSTGVMNNDQIVASVAQGVADAVSSVLGNGSQQPINVTLDGEVIYTNQQKVAQNRGLNFGMASFAR